MVSPISSSAGDWRRYDRCAESTALLHPYRPSTCTRACSKCIYACEPGSNSCMTHSRDTAAYLLKPIPFPDTEHGLQLAAKDVNGSQVHADTCGGICGGSEYMLALQMLGLLYSDATTGSKLGDRWGSILHADHGNISQFLHMPSQTAMLFISRSYVETIGVRTAKREFDPFLLAALIGGTGVAGVPAAA